MFLVHRVTTYTISLPPAIVLGRRGHELEEEELTLDDQRTAKRQLAAKIKDGIRFVESIEDWRKLDSTEGLDSISRESLTRLLALTDTWKHMVKDTLSSRPDYATQS
jgi:hypothetical protein